MAITGFRHLALSVTDLDRSSRWYAEALGFRELFRESHPGRSSVIMALPDTPVILGLVSFAEGDGAPFTPLHTGLDHACFTVESPEDLEGWMRRLDDAGILNSGIQQMTTGPILNFRDPDDIALAFALALPPEE